MNIDMTQFPKLNHKYLILSLLIITLIIFTPFESKYVKYYNSLFIEYYPKLHYSHSNIETINRKYSTININNQNDIKSLENKVQSIISKKDSINVIKIVFEKDIFYNDYIKTINVLAKSGVKSFIPINDSIFVFYLKNVNAKTNIPIFNEKRDNPIECKIY